MSQIAGGEERGRLHPDVSLALGQVGVRSAPELPQRSTDDGWMALARESLPTASSSPKPLDLRGYSSDLEPLSNRR